MSNTMLSPEVPTTWSSRPSTNDSFAYLTGPVVTYEESGTWTRRRTLTTATARVTAHRAASGATRHPVRTVLST